MTGPDPANLGRALDHLPLPTWVWVLEGAGLRLEAFNRAALSLSGDEVRQAVGRTAADLHPADSPVLGDLAAVADGAGPRQRVVPGESFGLLPGSGIYRLLYARPLDHLVLVHAEALAPDEHGDVPEPASFLSRLLGNLPGMAYRCRNDESWTMEFVSPGCEALTGVRPEALVGNAQRSFESLIHADDRTMVWHMVQAGLEDRGRFDVAYRIVRPDGQTRWVWEQGAGLRSGPEADDYTIIEGFITDITDRHELAVELQESERRFQSLVEQSLAGVYLIEEGRFTYVNRRFAEIFAVPVERVLALESILDLVHPEDREQVAENLRRRESGEAERVEQIFRGVRGDDGAVIHVEAHGSVVKREGRPVILGILLDVTDRMHASERYHQAQKMEALGRLAGGIAHDFNNVLSVIRTLAELLELEVGQLPAVAEDLGEIKRAAERGASLSRQLMAFSRPSPERLESLSLTRAVEGIIPMLERILGTDVQLETELDPALPTVEVDPSHVEQILMNLVINARDAMPDGGRLTVRTGRARRSPRGRANCVYMAVEDTGVGIPKEIRRRIFEPFFTTKGAKGTGLGLGNVWTIVDRYDGSVDVASQPGKGSTFTVYLPVEGALL